MGPDRLEVTIEPASESCPFASNLNKANLIIGSSLPIDADS